MAIKLRLQIIRKNTKYESFRITIPKALINANDFRDKDFSLKIKNGKIILTPLENEKNLTIRTK